MSTEGDSQRAKDRPRDSGGAPTCSARWGHECSLITEHRHAFFRAEMWKLSQFFCY